MEVSSGTAGVVELIEQEMQQADARKAGATEQEGTGLVTKEDSEKP